MLIALGISGGIAAYKSCEIARGLDRAGASVQVILTENAAQFITPLTLQTLTRNPVLGDQYELSTDDKIPHIDLTQRISALVVAPATADVIAKFARGIADDLLSTFFLTVTAPIIVVPSMNSRMLLNPVTQEPYSKGEIIDMSSKYEVAYRAIKKQATTLENVEKYSKQMSSYSAYTSSAIGLVPTEA